MALETINNNESGLSVRTKLNSMFTELYSSEPVPVKLINQNADTLSAVVSGDYIPQITIKYVSGTPLIKVGTTLVGSDLIEETTITDFIIAKPEHYFSAPGNIYFTISGGAISIRIDKIQNYF